MSTVTLPAGLDTDSTNVAAAAAFVDARCADCAHHAQRLGGDAVVDATHDLRVAVRRLRIALEVLVGKPAREVIRGLKRDVQDMLGTARDLDVMLAWAEAGARRGRAPTRAAFRRAVEILGPAQKSARGSFPWILERFTQLQAEARALAASAPRGGRLGGRKARARLKARRKAVDRALAKVARKRGAAAPAHAARIRVKKLRYHTEVLAPALGERVAKLLEPLEELQEVLGQLHDIDTRLAWLAAAGGLDALVGVEQRRRVRIARWSLRLAAAYLG